MWIVITLIWLTTILDGFAWIYQVLTWLIFLIVGLSLLPFIRDYISNRVNIFKKRWIRWIIYFVFIIIVWSIPQWIIVEWFKVTNSIQTWWVYEIKFLYNWWKVKLNDKKISPKIWLNTITVPLATWLNHIVMEWIWHIFMRDVKLLTAEEIEQQKIIAEQKRVEAEKKAQEKKEAEEKRKAELEKQKQEREAEENRKRTEIRNQIEVLNKKYNFGDDWLYQYEIEEKLLKNWFRQTNTRFTEAPDWSTQVKSRYSKREWDYKIDITLQSAYALGRYYYSVDSIYNWK